VGSGVAPWWLSIVTALMAGGFALLGVRLTQRHAAEQRRLDRLEDHRAEQRAAVVDLLAVGRSWAHSLIALLHVAHEMTPEAMTPEAAQASWAFREYLRTDELHTRALLAARLLVRDDPVREAAKNVSELANASPTLVRANLGVNAPEVTAVAVAAVDAYRDALLDLERVTRERLVDDPQEVRRRRWQRVRLPLPGRHSRPSSERSYSRRGSRPSVRVRGGQGRGSGVTGSSRTAAAQMPAE
jgi:hypothetical protein